MTVVKLDWREEAPTALAKGAVSIGNFDGVHLGHQALLGELRAHASNGPAVAVTFDPHPLSLLRPEQFRPLLTTIEERSRLMEVHGATHVVILRTTRELLSLSPEQFFTGLLVERLAAKTVVEGFNFAFGKDRQGNIDRLATLCQQAGKELFIVPPLEQDGVVVASSRVRSALESGNVRGAALLLGRPYRISGTVVRGRRRGQALGFPTANLEGIETLIPGDGVYAVRSHHQEQSWAGAANIGPNPTFGENIRKVEVHLIGFEGDLLGQSLQLDFIERLRDTRAFAGPDALAAQLRLDVSAAARLVSKS
jgi:riboflavin kinase/FMN adenylyltransferase